MSGRQRWLLPYLGSLFCAGHISHALAHGADALKDPGVGWHVVAGRVILQTRAVLRADPFSVTAAGRPWVDHYWLAHVLYSALERAGGLSLIATVSMLL